jgi:hypothetical protein
MNSFKLQYKLYVKIFLTFALLLSVAGVVFNVISVIEYSSISIVKTISHALLTAVSSFLCALVASLLFFGRYIIKDGKLITAFGILRFKSSILDAVNATHFKKTDILVLYYKNAEYSVIMISPEFYGRFLESIKKENPSFYSDVKSGEENI